MNTFFPPTDNLYKFLAISGLMIFCFFVIWPELQTYKLEQRKIEILGEQEVIKHEIDYINQDLDRIKQGEITFEKFFPILKQSREIAIKTAQISTKSKLLELTNARLKKITFFTPIGIALGLIMTLNGFALWYFKIQIWQDKAIRKEGLTKPKTP